MDRFCAPLCEAVWEGIEQHAVIDTQPFLESLQGTGLLCIPLDERGKWFRFHHMLRTHLKQRLEEQLRVDELATLHLRASEWFEEQGLVEGV